MARPIVDCDLTPTELASLSSVDAVADFFATLGYRIDARHPLSAEAIGLAGEAAAPFRDVELLAEDEDGFMRVVFVRVKSLTAKSRNDIARVLGRTNVDHLLILTSDFSILEFVLIDKRRRESRGPAGGQRIQIVPLVFAIDRKSVATKELRTFRRFTWTGRDGLEQFDKLRSVFEAAAFTEDYFCNRALFADYYLVTRLRDDPAWSESPTQPFQKVKEYLDDARPRWLGKGEQIVRDELYVPIFQVLGFKAKTNKKATDGQTTPDFLLTDSKGQTISAAFTYAWDRWLDGPDYYLDQITPDENPGACVVTALEEGVADWIVVTNGRQWRLYSRHAHSRATNFYEVDLPEALVASGDTDPNEAFRYWWLFFRSQSFSPDDGSPPKCWLDRIAAESTDYARELGERLKGRIFERIFPHLARGFLQDRKQRLGITRTPSEDDLRDVFQGTLTFLYRLLFLLYAESRDLLPVREAPYHEASLKKLKQEIADKAGVAESEVDVRIEKGFSAKESSLYDRLQRLFGVMDLGDCALNVPTYNGGLFITRPDSKTAADSGQEREFRIARFLAEHKVPDRPLALAIDLLARDEDPKTFSQVFIDYKSLAVRHLGSIYEGLLEFRLKIADEDLTTQKVKGREKIISLSTARQKRGRGHDLVARPGEAYISNERAERKSSGSYYTPDPIVEYIVEQAIGPVLSERLDGLLPKFRRVRKTFDNEVQKATAFPVKKPDGSTWEPREFALEKMYATHKDLAEELFEFRTLDPAMGSGHFLVEAVDFLTDRLLTFLNQFPINPVQVMLDRTRRNILAALGEQGVTVDPAKLTDVNLLKRHVLKRCIYGVDLNPMAVELAKVSLWLDAFTLGAPLSFLNHHLRWGNSLIGATMAGLREAVTPSKGFQEKGQRLQAMFGLNLQRMTEAIRQVIAINRLADATAAEVKQSANAYDAVRQNLDRYRIALDLLVASHFGVPEAPRLLLGNADLDLSSPEIATGAAARSVARVEQIAAQPEMRFFHWEIEFPEVFYAFADADQRRLLHKNEITAGSAGFDVVIGNPPYVRMELIKPLKPFLKPTFTCHAERADLFIYFFEQAVRLLRRGGRSAFIASSTWTKTKAGESLRDFLKANTTIASFLDFGDLPVFPEATTYPAVMVVESGPPVPQHLVASASVPDLEDMYFTRLLESRRIDVPQTELHTSGWSFEDRRIARLREKIQSAGVPLAEFCGAPLYGIKTGLNDAFVVDLATYERLVAEDRSSIEILKPFLEGKDVKPWRYEWRGLWLIYTHHGIDIDRYPAIKRHLATYRARLEERATSSSHKWYELQQPQLAYSKPMKGPKVIWPQITNRSSFAVDLNGYSINNKIYFIPFKSSVDAFFLTGVLNSPVIWHMITAMATPKMNNYYELIANVIERLPIAKAESQQMQAIATLAAELSTNTGSRQLEIEAELNARVAGLYGMTAEDAAIVRYREPRLLEAAMIEKD